MNKAEAKMIMKEFLEDCDKTQPTEHKSPLRKAFDLAYQELCRGGNENYFEEKEIDLMCSAIISSPVDTSRELQDRVLALLNENALPF